MSPSDSVSSLRVTIQADIMKTISGDSAGHRHGQHAYHGCPPFAFFYADGVAIDRGQEERLSVNDIAVQSSTDDRQWGVGNESVGGVQREMHVFLRACEPRTKQATTDDGAGVLHRWESLHGGSWSDEVRKQARVASVRKAGSTVFQGSSPRWTVLKQRLKKVEHQARLSI